MTQNTIRWLILSLTILLALTIPHHAPLRAQNPTQELLGVTANHLTWATDGQTLVVTTRNAIDLYANGQWDTPRARFATDIAYSIDQIIISTNGTYIATRHDPEKLGWLNIDDDLSTSLGWLWDVETGTRAFELSGHTALTRLRALAFSPDEALIAYGGVTDGLIHVRDTISGTEVAVLNPVTDDPGWEPDLVISVLNELVFSPDGTTLATSHHSGNIVIWDTTTWKRLNVLYSSNPQYLVTYNTSSETLIARNSLGFPEVWNVRDGRNLSMFTRGEITVDKVGFDVAGHGLGILVEPDRLLVFELESGTQRAITFEGLDFPKIHPPLQFSPRPATLLYWLSLGRKAISTFWLLNLETATIPFTTTVPYSTTNALSPDGTQLAIGSQGAVDIWDIDTNTLIGTITLPDAPPPDFGS